MKHRLIVLATALLAIAAAHAQVVNSIGQENMKIPRGNKPEPTRQQKPLPTVTIDTDTRYYALVDSAQAAIERDDLDQAIAHLTAAIASDPSNTGNTLLLSNIATLQRHKGDLGAAARNYSLALDITPNAVTLLLNRAALYVQMDSIALAQRDYERAAELDPANTEARYSLGMLAAGRNDYKKAEDYFNEIRRINSNSGLYDEGMGMMYKQQGQYDAAVRHLSRVIEAHPTAALLGNRADCYLTAKRLNDAEEDIRRALDLSPNDPFLFLLRAKLNKLRFNRDDMNRDIELAVAAGLSRDYINAALNPTPSK